jgi:hypothetical protein
VARGGRRLVSRRPRQPRRRISAGRVEKRVALLDAQEHSHEIDAAHRRKYGRYSAHLEPMVSPQARTTTLRLVPRSLEHGAA